MPSNYGSGWIHINVLEMAILIVTNISLLITLHVTLKRRQWLILWDLSMYR